MKNTVATWILTIMMIFVGFDAVADSSTSSNYIFTADGMHLQEVLLRLELLDQEQQDCYFLIKKSQDGINFRIIAEVEDIKLQNGVIIIADHLRANKMTHYQLVRVDANGENIVETTTFDPNAQEDGEGVMLGMSDKNNNTGDLGDPHDL